jgi:hypothetical protein
MKKYPNNATYNLKSLEKKGGYKKREYLIETREAK